eukprot:sb/3463896/
MLGSITLQLNGLACCYYFNGSVILYSHNYHNGTYNPNTHCEYIIDIDWDCNLVMCVELDMSMAPGSGKLTETSRQPIRTHYLGHMTGYQPIRDQNFLIRSVPDTQLRNTLQFTITYKGTKTPFNANLNDNSASVMFTSEDGGGEDNKWSMGMVCVPKTDYRSVCEICEDIADQQLAGPEGDEILYGGAIPHLILKQCIEWGRWRQTLQWPILTVRNGVLNMKEAHMAGTNVRCDENGLACCYYFNGSVILYSHNYHNGTYNPNTHCEYIIDIDWDCNLVMCVELDMSMAPGSGEPTRPRKQPIRTGYLGHVTGYQLIWDQYFLIRSVLDTQLRNTLQSDNSLITYKGTKTPFNANLNDNSASVMFTSEDGGGEDNKWSMGMVCVPKTDYRSVCEICEDIADQQLAGPEGDEILYGGAIPHLILKQCIEWGRWRQTSGVAPATKSAQPCDGSFITFILYNPNILHSTDERNLFCETYVCVTQCFISTLSYVLNINVLVSSSVLQCRITGRIWKYIT